MPANVTMSLVYRELKSLRKDIETVKYAIIPEEKLSARELKELREIRKEMETGKEKTFREVFG